MMTVLLALATGALTTAAAPPSQTERYPPARAKNCQYIPQLATRPEVGKTTRMRDDPMLLSAVDRRVHGCSVLVVALTGKMIAPPETAEGPARLMPIAR